MEHKRIKNLIAHCGKLIESFSKETGSFAVDFQENKKYAVWSMNYNLLKVQFVYTKKEKLLVPISTLFCRIYLGKNEEFFYHIPELIEYLDETDFRCYYFSYIESEERMEACFLRLALFLKKHMKKMNEIAMDSEKCAEIKEKKLSHIQRLSMEGEYVLLLRFTAEGAYREFLRGNYQKAIAQYEKMLEKKQLTAYEERLLIFLKELEEPYEALPKECDSVLEAKEFNGSLKDGMAYLLGAFVCEIVFGAIGCIVVLVISGILSRGSIAFFGAPWYAGLLGGGLPAIFGTIALRRPLAKITRRKNYKKAMEYDEILNSEKLYRFTYVVFAISVIFSIIATVSLSVCTTGFYKDHLTFHSGEEMISFQFDSCNYNDLKEVIYSEGVYNDYGDFIDRPSYLFIFSDGTVWDSDGFTSVEKVEKEILPIIEGYYNEIRTVESRNEYIE